MCGEAKFEDMSPLPPWKLFTFTWADSGASAFSSSDETFFAEVADRLHNVDFTAPSEPFLEEPQVFREWLTSIVARREG